MDTQKIDVAIIGGGIAGLYCCYHLSRSEWFRGDASKTIALYEASSRLGGRIETWRIDPRKLRNLVQNQREAFVPVAELIDTDPQLADILVAEFGPMRIEPDQQPYLKQLLKDVGISEPTDGEQQWSDLVRFPSYQADQPTEPRFDLTGEEGEQETLIDLLLLALRRIFEVISTEPNPWKIGSATYDEANFYWNEFRKENFLHRRFWKAFLREWINLLEDEHYQIIREQFQFREIPFYKLGFWNLLSGVMSHMAIVKLRDWGSFYHLLPENPNAAEWVVFWLRAIKSTDSLRGIRGGMDWIVLGLSQKLGFLSPDRKRIHTDERGNPLFASTDKRLSLNAEHKLVKIEVRRDQVLLSFENNAQVAADHVILALPKGPLERLHCSGDPELVANFKAHLDAVFAFPLLKCFFIVDHPWWEDGRRPNSYAHYIPTRELHYWKNRDKTAGMIMVYTDRPGTQFWADFLTESLLRGREQSSATIWRWEIEQELGRRYGGDIEKFTNQRLLRTFLLYARENGLESVTANRLLAAGIRDWGLKPYEGAAHSWRPGSQSWDTIEYMRAFSLMRGGENRLHVCGEAFSDYQGFIEGALRSAREVLVQPPFSVLESALKEQGPKRLPRMRTAPGSEDFRS